MELQEIDSPTPSMGDGVLYLKKRIFRYRSYALKIISWIWNREKAF